VLYLERPPRNRAQLESLQVALRIQRLEGSRLHGSLCTLNRSERMPRDQAQAELGFIGWLKRRMGQHIGLRRPDVEAGTEGVSTGRGKESANAPKQGPGPEM